MYRLDGLNVELTREDSLTLLVSFPGRELPEGTRALFTIKKHPKDPVAVLEKEMNVEGSRAEIVLSSAETDLPARTYWWDLRLMIPGEEMEILTPMEYAAFSILEVIGDV